MNITVRLCPKHMRSEAQAWSTSYPKIGYTFEIVEETPIMECPCGCNGSNYACAQCSNEHFDFLFARKVESA